jgi:hypothetical protein
MSVTKQAAAYTTIESVLNALKGSTKIAEESHTEAGGHDGPTTHPVKNEDDGTEEASTGARAKENEKDVKEDQGEPGVTGKETKAFDINQDSVQLNINTKNRATGEDPENETGRAKGGKEDGGYQGASSHPARTDNSEIDGHKWANVGFAQQLRAYRQAVKTAEDKSNDALASIASFAHGATKEKVAAIQKAATDNKPAEPAAPADTPRQAGAKLAQAMLTGTVDGHDKQAEFAEVVSDIHATILAGYRAADQTIGYLQGLQKAAEEGGEEDPSSDRPSEGGGEERPPEEGGGEAPPSDGGAGAGGEGDMLAALTGGGGGDAGGGAPPMGGGAPPMGGGAPPMGGAGGPPPGGDPLADMMGGGAGGPPPAPPGGAGGPGGMPGGGGMAGGIDPQMLMAALQQLGISPEMLDQLAQAKTAAFLNSQVKLAAAQQGWRPKTAGEQARYQHLIQTLTEMTQGA